MDVYVVYNNDEQIKPLKDIDIKNSPFFHFIDERTFKGKKEAWRIKRGLSAKLSPFAAVYECDNPTKAFYTEADNDIIKSLIEYLNE